MNATDSTREATEVNSVITFARLHGLRRCAVTLRYMLADEKCDHSKDSDE